MKRILLIEDHGPMRRNLEIMLTMESFEVLTAESGRIGLEIARASQPDLILCDIMMPELDGYEVLRALRNEPVTSTTPFIFLTAKGEKADLRAGMNLGADDYLTKPVLRDELLAAISARLARKQAEFDAPRAGGTFQPDFSSPEPLRRLGLTPREAEALLWVAQGKTNPEIATILGTTERTVKEHLTNIFQKLGVETRTAASLRALEVLNGAGAPARGSR